VTSLAITRKQLTSQVCAVPGFALERLRQGCELSGENVVSLNRKDWWGDRKDP